MDQIRSDENLIVHEPPIQLKKFHLLDQMRVVITQPNLLKVAVVQALLTDVLGHSIPFTVVEAPAVLPPAPLHSLKSVKQSVVSQLFNASDESASYFIAIESGIDREFDQFYGFVFASVADATRNRFGFGTSLKFPLSDDL
jgi:non-canonical (house-cleaning) NTP pyrophosphatase